MNGHTLAFHLLCSLHLILSIITVGKYCSAMDISDEVEVATIAINAVIIDQIAIPIKFDNVSCAMTA